jgi:hypothetical protein
VAGDFDGDGAADLAVWRGGTGTWFWVTTAGASFGNRQWGNQALGDVTVTGDIDGDRKADLALWRASTGTWYWLTSSTGYSPALAGAKQWGNQSLGDVPMLGDVDGDGRSDLVIWRASTGTWHWLTSSSNFDYASSGIKQWGNAALGDRPLLGDVDGDGRADLCVWRPGTGTWYWLTSASGYSYASVGLRQWGNGAMGDRPLLADVDGDKQADFLVWRPFEGVWYWLTSSSAYNPAAFRWKQWGNTALGDVPLAADFDGDGSDDLAVWRPGDGTWYWLKSSTGFDITLASNRQFGNQAFGDAPAIR